jgi:hypothetical protein
LPSQGVYCVTSIDNNKNARNRFAESLDGLVQLIQELKQSHVNIFVAPGSFIGHSRKADSAAFLRSFFIDLDVGVGKDYGSKEEALEAIEFLCADTGLPPPTRVDSGSGIHAYWVFDEDIPAVLWKLYAEKFKQRVIECIPIDRVVTSDSARIMRSPYTTNYKYDLPLLTGLLDVEVEQYSFAAFREFLGDIEFTPSLVLATVSKGLDEDMREILKSDNIETVFEAIVERSLNGGGCDQIRYIIENETTLSEPLWHSGLSIARHCIDWEEMIHKMSSDYPGYSPEHTIRKANETFGKPHSCDVFNARNPGICENCPHYGRITNPLSLGRKLKEAEPPTEEMSIRQDEAPQEIQAFPTFMKPYARGANGGVYFVPPSKNDDEEDGGGPLLLVPNDFLPVKRMYSPHDGECLMMRIALPRDPDREFLLPLKSVYAVDEFKKLLSSNGVIFVPTMQVVNHLMNYVIKWEQYLMNMDTAEQMRMQMGWTENDASFVVGRQEITPKGVIKSAASPMVHSIARLLTKVGDYDLWREAVKKLNRPGFEIHQFGLFCGFGSPLMKFTSTSGVTVSFAGPSGTAKTGAIYSAVSIYGNPKELSLAGERNATDNGMVGWYLALKNIVFGLDEVSNRSGQEISSIVHRVSTGKGKIRMHSQVNAVRELEQSASLINLLSTNQPVYDKVMQEKASPDGEVARIIEFIVNKPKVLEDNPHLGREIFDVFRTNYGHAVYPYIEYIYKLGFDEVKKRVAKWGARFNKDFGSDNSYRFYENCVAVSFAGAEIAIEAGIIEADIERVYEQIVHEITAIRDGTIRINSADYKGMLGEFMNRYQTGVLIVDGDRVIHEPRSALIARFEMHTQMFYVSKTELRRFLSEIQVSAREFEKKLKSDDVIAFIGRQRLTNGWSGAVSTPIAVYGFKADVVDVPSGLKRETGRT